MGSGASAGAVGGATAPLTATGGWAAGTVSVEASRAGAVVGAVSDAVYEVSVRPHPPEAVKGFCQTPPTPLVAAGLDQRNSVEHSRVGQAPGLPGSCAPDEDVEQGVAPGSMDGGEGGAAHERRVITKDFKVLRRYALGGEVMPSTHPDMQVRYATRKEDGLCVVVKIRGKRGSFVDAEEEKAWRSTTELMLNLPDCESRAKYIEVCEDHGRYWIVMERCEGVDLYEFLEKSSYLPKASCLEILRQTLSAVAELHARGLIHKDLKLENVMIDAPERCHSPTALMNSTCSTMTSGTDSERVLTVKLIDFDTVEPYTPKEVQTAKTVTGTDQYISQEAYAGKYSPASDMFAVGVIAYRLMAGAFPFLRTMFDDEAGENWVGSPKMKQIQDRLRRVRVSFDRPAFHECPAAKDFCESLLAVEEQSRPSAVEALRHPLLSPPPPAAPSRASSGWFPSWR